jgi:hypothetical protein
LLLPHLFRAAWICHYHSPPKNPLIMGFISIICSRPSAS